MSRTGEKRIGVREKRIGVSASSRSGVLFEIAEVVRGER
jgi:hypothetical protein